MEQPAILTALRTIQRAADEGRRGIAHSHDMRETIDRELNRLLDAVNPRHERKTRECLQAVLRELVNQAVLSAPWRIKELYPIFALLCGTSRDTFPRIEWLRH